MVAAGFSQSHVDRFHRISRVDGFAYMALRWRSCVYRQVKRQKSESAEYWSGNGKVATSATI
ncbi:MAG: hypothetical protein ACRDHZ_10725, partial [Ktedonobacteraceae bacterium]